MHIRTRRILLTTCSGIAILLLIWCLFVWTIRYAISTSTFSRWAYEYTGHQVSFGEKPIFKIFPSPTIIMNNITISSKAPFTAYPLATARKAVIEIKRLPLLFLHAQAKKIEVHDLTIYLDINKQGQKNWATWQRQEPQVIAQSLNQDADLNFVSTALKIRGHKPTIDSFIITNGTIHYTNEKTNQHWSFIHLNLRAQNIALGKKFPISIKCQYHSPHSSFSVKIHSKGIMKLTLLYNLYQLRHTTFITIHNPPYNILPIRVSSHIDWDANTKEIDFSQITLNLFNLTIQGNTAVNYSFNIPNFHFQLTTTTPSLKEFLLKSINQSYMDGQLNSQIDLTTMGLGLTNLIQYLNGTVELSLFNGILYGLNIEDLIPSPSLKKTVTIQSTHSKHISIPQLSGNFSFTNGIINNNDLLASISKSVKLSGSGNINLKQNTLSYRLIFLQTNPNENSGLPENPILIQGPMNNPTVSLAPDNQ